MKLFDATLLPVFDPTLLATPDPIRWDELKRVGQPLGEQLDRASSDLWNRIQERHRQKPQPQKDDSRQADRNLEEAEYFCRQFQRAVSDLIEFCEDPAAILTNRPAMLLVGEAGQGKTHLLCDIAEKDLKENRPRILLHGSHFADGEPWTQVVRMLGLSCSTEEFLGALEAAGRAYGCRIILLIDALNEGEGRRLWEKHLPGMLAALAGNPWIGIGVSVRSSYEQLVIPQSLTPTRLTRVVHPGFEEHEYESVNRFFTHYGIQPTTPLLVPEFTNPLFLKLFCQGVKANGWTQVPLGLRGITAILNMFLEAINGKLWKPDRMNYDRASNPVRQAADVIVRLMAKSDMSWLPREQVVREVNEVHPVAGHDRSLFRNLVAEGLLTENRWWVDGEYKEIVSFAYERFGDHLLAEYLLNTSLNRKSAKQSFGPQTKLGKLLKTEYASSRYAGLIEALSIQLPERIGKELFELAPAAAKFDVVREGFIKSLVWRDSKAFTDSTFGQINELFRYKNPSEEILNAMLTVGPILDHPLNADKLHTVLSSSTMAERDGWWSVFLHSEWQRGRAVSRMIDWVWGESDKSSLPEPVVLLTGTTLAWFLTSSHRFLRDRATKALVKLFENRLRSFQKLLDRFWTVNDPYVLERLLAAGYGCVMRSQDENGLADLAANVSKHVFQERTVLPQLLTRDYARGVIEYARQRSVVAINAFPLSRPPYKSKWPNMKIPTKATLEKWGERPKDKTDADWVQREVYSSVMSDWSDFSRYVIGDLMEWSTIRLSTAPPKSVKEQFDEFIAQLRPAQRKKLETYQTVTANVQYFCSLSAEDRVKHFKDQVTETDLQEALSGYEQQMIAILQDKPDLLRIFQEIAKPYIEKPYRYKLDHTFDKELARRWMVQRIMDCGWTVERFGEFDWAVNRWRNTGREANKAERIGKKYQWIAYHELLARLSDNFYMRKDRFSDNGLQEYSGPWDIGHGSARDIDPSLLVRSTPLETEMAGRAWWSPVAYSGWNAPTSDIDWLKTTDDLPVVEDLLAVRSPKCGHDWCVLDTFLEWKQPAKPGRKDYEQPQRNLWYMIHSYIVRRADATVFFRWAKRQDFMGRWMPEPQDVYHVHLGEYFWAAAYLDTLAGYHTNGWTRGDFDRVPTDVLVTAIDFVHESSGFDCSVDRSIRITLPAGMLASGLKLRWSGSEGRYIDPAGRLAALDPSVFEPGPGALLVRRDALQKYLADNDLELFWTLLGEKQLIGGDRNVSGRLEISGAYRLTPRGIIGHVNPVYQDFTQQKPRRRKPPVTKQC